jgi:hypothetical protein
MGSQYPRPSPSPMPSHNNFSVPQTHPRSTMSSSFQSLNAYGQRPSSGLDNPSFFDTSSQQSRTPPETPSRNDGDNFDMSNLLESGGLPQNDWPEDEGRNLADTGEDTPEEWEHAPTLLRHEYVDGIAMDLRLSEQHRKSLRQFVVVSTLLCATNTSCLPYRDRWLVLAWIPPKAW